MASEAVILAHHSACLANVGGKPLLEHAIRYFLSQGVRRFVVSIADHSGLVEAFLRQVFPSLDYVLLLREDERQTGGAIRHALYHIRGRDVIVFTGHMYCHLDLAAMQARHRASGAECTLLLRHVHCPVDSMGVVTDEDGRVTGVAPSEDGLSGVVAAGVYMLDRDRFLSRPLPETFSFEQDYLIRYTTEGVFAGYPDDGACLDLREPEDIVRANAILAPRVFDPSAIDRTWTLFLDRDGVINVNIPNDYVRTWDAFRWEAGAKEAIALLSRRFGRIVVITNQRGVGKGWMTQADLDDIHARMTAQVEAAGGRIDAIFACDSTDDKHYDRKPNPGMAFKARQRFPEIDFARSVMCGDKPIDMQWAKNIGGFGAWIMPGGEGVERSGGDVRFGSLASFAAWVLDGR